MCEYICLFVQAFAYIFFCVHMRMCMCVCLCVFVLELLNQDLLINRITNGDVNVFMSFHNLNRNVFVFCES